MSSDRISMPEVFMRFAETVALRSVCDRNVQVGAVIATDTLTNVVSIGYNGPARGLPHDCMSITQAPVERQVSLGPIDFVKTQPVAGTCTCVHAEANALIKAPYDAGSLVMFTTLSPCPACARLILNSRVTVVYYREEYRIPEGLKIVRSRLTAIKLPREPFSYEA
jgi:dCMP deaminase